MCFISFTMDSVCMWTHTMNTAGLTRRVSLVFEKKTMFNRTFSEWNFNGSSGLSKSYSSFTDRLVVSVKMMPCIDRRSLVNPKSTTHIIRVSRGRNLPEPLIWSSMIYRRSSCSAVHLDLHSDKFRSVFLDFHTSVCSNGMAYHLSATSHVDVFDPVSNSIRSACTETNFPLWTAKQNAAIHWTTLTRVNGQSI